MLYQGLPSELVAAIPVTNIHNVSHSLHVYETLMQFSIFLSLLPHHPQMTHSEPKSFFIFNTDDSHFCEPECDDVNDNGGEE